MSFYGSHKWDDGAGTDLMFQFCLPYVTLPVSCDKISV